MAIKTGMPKLKKLPKVPGMKKLPSTTMKKPSMKIPGMKGLKRGY